MTSELGGERSRTGRKGRRSGGCIVHGVFVSEDRSVSSRSSSELVMGFFSLGTYLQGIEDWRKIGWIGMLDGRICSGLYDDSRTVAYLCE